MMRAAAAQGAELLLGRVTAIAHHHGRATGVVVAGEIIEADAVVVAMGPWSILAALSLPLPAIFGLKGHSLVFDTGDTVPGEALFVEYREPSSTVLSPEVFPRTDGTTYVCANPSGLSTLPFGSRYSTNRASPGTVSPVSNTRLWPFNPKIAGSGNDNAASIDQGPIATTTASASMISPATTTPVARPWW